MIRKVDTVRIHHKHTHTRAGTRVINKYLLSVSGARTGGGRFTGCRKNKSINGFTENNKVTCKLKLSFTVNGFVGVSTVKHDYETVRTVYFGVVHSNVPFKIC